MHEIYTSGIILFGGILITAILITILGQVFWVARCYVLDRPMVEYKSSKGEENSLLIWYHYFIKDQHTGYEDFFVISFIVAPLLGGFLVFVWPLTLAILLVWSILYSIRAGVRFNKKLNEHINDKEAHQ